MGATMTTDVLLDLTKRPTARVHKFLPGSPVWYREDVRLSDGAARVVPAVFVAYGWRARHVAIVPSSLTADGRHRWVSPDDVIARHWGDDAVSDGGRMADAGPLLDTVAPLPVVVVIGSLVVLAVVAVWVLS
jgi:hypothetical protein